jgi:hypothetical protein
MNAEQDVLDKDPSVPQGLPARKAIALAGQEAAKAGNGTAKIADGPLGLGTPIQQSHHLNDFRGNDLCGRQIGCQTRQVSQPEQAHANGGQDGQQVFKRADGMHAAILEVFAYPPETVHRFGGICKNLQQEVLDQLGNDATQFYAIHQRYITDAWGTFRLTGETYRQRGGKAVDKGTGSPGRT